MNTNRIPAFTERTFDGMLLWFGEMNARDLLFHPDDQPEDIIVIATGEPTFTHEECVVLDQTLAEMFTLFGDKVYEAAYPYVMTRMGLPLDA